MNRRRTVAALRHLAWLTVAVLAVFIPAFPTFAGILNECDFETGLCGTDWQNYSGGHNTFSNYGILPLLGGGNYCIALKAKSDTPSGSKIDWSYDPVSEVYIRFYLYFPTGYTARSDFGNTLKLLRHSYPVSTEDSDLKLGLDGGVLKLQQRAFYKPFTGAAYTGSKIPSGGFERDRWHYVECHYKHLSSSDIMQIWIDADARTAPPTWSETEVDVYDHDFPRATFNINWSADAPATQQFYMDGLVVSTQPVGDTCNLLADTTSPASPTGVSANAP
jgi:hypothetical protein